MPANALAEPAGVPTRQRADCGRYVRLTHAERLQGLGSDAQDRRILKR